MPPKRTAARKESGAAELRRAAVARLQESKKGETHPATQAEAKRLLHELQVHQIELEMQNEELARSRAESESLLRQLRDLYDFAPVGYFTLARDGTIHQVNLAGANLLGVERGKLIRRRFGVFVSPRSRTTFNAFLDKTFTTGSKEDCEVELLKDGSDPLWAHMEATCSEDGGQCGAVVLDVTERKRAEEALRESEERYRQLFEDSPVGIYRTTPDGRILAANPAIVRLLGFSSFEELAAHNLEQDSSDASYSRRSFKEQVERSGRVTGLEAVWRRRDGTPIFVRENAQVIRGRTGAVVCYDGTIEDITERKRAEEALRESEERFRALIEHSHDAITLLAADGTVLYDSPSVVSVLGYSPTERIGRRVFEYVHPEEREGMAHGFAKFARQAGAVAPSEVRFIHKDGTPRWIEGVRTNLLHEPTVRAVVVNYRDITDRKRAEEALRRGEARLEEAQRIAHVGSWEWIAETDTPAWSRELCAILEVDPAKPVPKLAEQHTLYTPDSMARMNAAVESAMQTGAPYEIELERVRADGTRRWLLARGERWFDEERRFLVGLRGTALDITERKKTDEALRRRLAELEALHSVSAGLRAARTRDEALPVLLDETLATLETDAGVIWLHHDAEGGDLRAAVARGWFRQVTDTPMKPGEGIGGTVFASGQTYISIEFRSDSTARATTRGQAPPGWGGACVPIRAGAVTIGVLFVSVPHPRRITTEQVQLLESLAEMAGAALHRMRLHEATARQLDQLQALRRVDEAIAASMDLPLTLGILLNQVTGQLHVDAADVLLLNPHLQTLAYAAGHGFRGRAIERSRFRLGEGQAGQAALERRMIQHPDFVASGAVFAQTELLAGENVAAYFAVPLIAKGEVKGVLEIFHRSPLKPDAEWLNFLETLAGQAAIAVDNAQLFDGLQRSNLDLTLAYDATIEGWSHALDLRDRETEGHVLRVTEITLRLAKVVGIAEAEIVHIRRGALLHDIGKMGVPDAILLKPGPLTDDEWKLMRLHPGFAYDMLSPINYLRPALDIPYCHHEKWDGTGYPRSLKGEQIPLAARLFAVVDVWDALRSDRPYRSAWLEEKVIEYIQAESGSHFDPTVVEVFLKVVSGA